MIVPVLKVLTDRTLDERAFFMDVKKRMEESDLVKNPFRGRLDMVSTEKEIITVIVLDPFYPDIIPKIGFFLAGVSALFGWWVLFSAGLFLGATYLLWTEKFYFWVLKRARKKQGLSGSIKRLGDKEAWEGVMSAWDR